MGIGVEADEIRGTCAEGVGWSMTGDGGGGDLEGRVGDGDGGEGDCGGDCGGERGGCK